MVHQIKSIGIIFFMESLGLKNFLKSIGRPIHSLNTICVGLSGVEQGLCKKPEKLTIAWEPKDLTTSARMARLFAIESSLVFVEESLLQYLRYIISHPATPQDIKNLDDKNFTSAEKLEKLSEIVKPEKIYWTSITLLLIHWRNRIIHHHSKAKLSKKHIKILEENKKTIKAEHANIDIEKTINNFENKKITLKDISTIISVTIKYVRQIDEYLQVESDSKENVEFWIKYLKLKNEYNKLFYTNKNNKFKKYKQFFNTYLPFISDKTILDIIAHNKTLDDE